MYTLSRWDLGTKRTSRVSSGGRRSRVLSISHCTGADVLSHAVIVPMFLLEKPCDTSHESQGNGELLSKTCEISCRVLKTALCGFIKNELLLCLCTGLRGKIRNELCRMMVPRGRPCPQLCDVRLKEPGVRTIPVKPTKM